MQLLRKKGNFDSTRILFLPVDAIAPNPDQPRRVFAQQELDELARSIQSLGLLQPLTVRRSAQGGWELVAGERRLRAARLAGLQEVPSSPSRSTASAPLCWPWWKTYSGRIWIFGRRLWLWRN